MNEGRILYKYAGDFLETARIICLKKALPNTQEKVTIENTIEVKSKSFEIDCLVKNNDCEIKRKEVTTDGDYITKEHTRIKVIKDAGYKQIRIIFYYPKRFQTINIQKALETLCHGIGREYYDDSDLNYIKLQTGVDLQQILEELEIEVENRRTN